MKRERLISYYDAQTPSDACLVRLCNLNHTQKPKKPRARLALPLAAACLLALVLVTQLRPARTGAAAPLLPSVLPAQETQLPVQQEPPLSGNAEPNPPEIGEGSENLMPAPTDNSFVTGSYADGIVTLTDSATGETLELYVPEGEETEYTWTTEAFGRTLTVQLTLYADGDYSLSVD